MGKLKPCRSPSQEGESPDRVPEGHPSHKGGLLGPARHTQGERPSQRAGGVGGGKRCRSRPLSRRELGPQGGLSQRRGAEGATIAPAIPVGKLRPGEGWCFVSSRGGAGSLVPRAPPGPPRLAQPSIPPRALQPGGAARTHRVPREGTAGSAGPPYLDDGSAGGGGGGGVRLRAPHRPPSPHAQLRRLFPPRQPGGRGRWAGPGPGTSPARAPRVRAHPSFPTLRTALLARGAGLGARARAQNRRAHAAEIGAGCPATRRRLGTGGPTAPSLHGTGQGTRPPEPPFPPR